MMIVLLPSPGVVCPSFLALWAWAMPTEINVCKYWAILMGIVVLLAKYTESKTSSAIARDFIPNSVIYPEEIEAKSFKGNSSHMDHFSLLQLDGDWLLIGARNIVYNISIYSLRENYNERLVWHSRSQDSSTCFNKGKSENQCQNYIRVLAKIDEGTFIVCGTNAFKPLCRQYMAQSDGSFSYEESSGVGKCPFDPNHNSTYTFTGDQLYSGTVTDFQGQTSLIFREPLKTDPNDYKQLNAPDFVHSMAYGDYVFFFFRETATEYMNCGKRVYSRVARVCKHDKGGKSTRFSDSWTTFLKTRLNCSVPGSFPFYFDEMQSASDVIGGIYGSQEHEIIYGVFTTPLNSLPGSAICAFSMAHIQDAFLGLFKEQETVNSNWLPVSPSQVPDPRPGVCVNNSKSLPEANINFVKSHPLVDAAVPTFFGRPLLMKASLDYRFTKIVIDPQVGTLDGATVDVLFIGTDVGIIFKAINALSYFSTKEINPVIIEEIRVTHHPIMNLQISRGPAGQTSLIVVTDDEVKSIPLHRCHRPTTCSECVGLQDPYCAWFDGSGRCGGRNATFVGPLLQNLTSGFHQNCPYDGSSSTPITPYIGSITPYFIPTTQTQIIGYAVGASLEGGRPIYGGETLAVAVTVSCVMALVIGFISGFLFSRKCQPKDEYGHKHMPYLSAKLNKDDMLGKSAPTTMYVNNGKHINNLVTGYNLNSNLVTSYNPKSNNGKNTTTSTDTKMLQTSKCAYI